MIEVVHATLSEMLYKTVSWFKSFFKYGNTMYAQKKFFEGWKN